MDEKKEEKMVKSIPGKSVNIDRVLKRVLGVVLLLLIIFGMGYWIYCLDNENEQLQGQNEDLQKQNEQLQRQLENIQVKYEKLKAEVQDFSSAMFREREEKRKTEDSLAVLKERWQKKEQREKSKEELLASLQENLDEKGIKEIAFVGFINHDDFKDSKSGKQMLNRLWGEIERWLFKARNNKYKLIERGSAYVEELMKANSLALSETIDESTANEFCKQLDVDAIVVGRVNVFEQSVFEQIRKIYNYESVDLKVILRNAEIVWMRTFRDF